MRDSPPNAAGVDHDGAALPGGAGGQAGVLVTEIAELFGLPRQAVYRWVNGRYRDESLDGLADRSH